MVRDSPDGAILSNKMSELAHYRHVYIYTGLDVCKKSLTDPSHFKRIAAPICETLIQSFTGFIPIYKKTMTYSYVYIVKKRAKYVAKWRELYNVVCYSKFWERGVPCLSSFAFTCGVLCLRLKASIEGVMRTKKLLQPNTTAGLIEFPDAVIPAETHEAGRVR